MFNEAVKVCDSLNNCLVKGRGPKGTYKCKMKLDESVKHYRSRGGDTVAP